ncbi:bromodomain adjacent to zinc finger domain protein 1A-like isoform X2 [Dysidea avara]|uniref:bromodomain adjacent to zinc finger domain protein 1A-like isoform X2 n=1 Tax=Dysidea avara TaxID=196820 RepID=UPI00332DDA5C
MKEKVMYTVIHRRILGWPVYALDRVQVTITEVIPPPIPDTPSSSVVTTPSSVASPANGVPPVFPCDPSPSVENHVTSPVTQITPRSCNTGLVALSNSTQSDDAPSSTPKINAAPSSSSSKKKRSRRKSYSTPIAIDATCPPAAYQYTIKMSDGLVKVVPANCLSRRKGMVTSDKLRFFLKAALYKTSLDNKSPLLVKDEFLQKFSLGESKVLPKPSPSSDSNDFKSPPTPSATKKRHLSQSSLDMYFASSLQHSSTKQSSSVSKKPSKSPNKPDKAPSKKETKKSPGKVNQKSVIKVSAKKVKHSPPKSLQLVTSGSTQVDGGSNMQPIVVSQSPSSKPPRTPVKTPTKSPFLSRTVSTSVIMSAKKTRTLKEIRNQLKRKFLTTEQRMKLEGEMKHKLDEKKEEQKQLRQKLREQRLAEKQRLHELMKPREDLMCEDSKPLPEPSLLRLRVPEEHFADVAMILEFLNAFGPVFEVEEVIQRKINYDLIEEALLSKDIQGPLFDIVKFLLQAVFAMMEEEAELKVSLTEDHSSNCTSPTQDLIETGEKSTGESSAAGKDDHDDKQNGGLRVNMSGACVHAIWPLQHQGVSLDELVLNSYTLSEVLRLHLLSTGGYQDNAERRTTRYQRRGGFTDGDDPAIDFVAKNGPLLDNLHHTSLFDMGVEERLLVLKVLCSQLLTYSVTRDAIEDSVYKLKKANRSYQELLRKGHQHKKDKKKAVTANSKKKDGKKQVEKSKDQSAGNGEQHQEGKEENDNPTVKDSNEMEDSTNSDLQPTSEKEDTAQTTLPVSQQNGHLSDEGEETAKTDQLSMEKPDAKEEDMMTEEERSRLKEELHSEILMHLSASNLKPLGVDRLHRRYWLFHSLSGVFVEQDPSLSPPPCNDSVVSSPGTNPSVDTEDFMSLEPKPQPVEDPQTDSTDKNEIAGADVTRPTEYKWWCYSNVDDFEALLNSLNPRGIREKELKASLESYKDHILSTIHKCPFVKDRTSKPLFHGYDGNLTADEYLELCLREQILDIEEKIWSGGLGFAKNDKRGDRDGWRDKIESSGAAKKIERYHEVNKRKERRDSENEVDSSKTILEIAEEHNSAVVHELSQILLQIEDAIERKYLTAPLGTAVYEDKKKQKVKKVSVKSCLEKWRASLSVASNFSQVFLHLFTLERCVAWSRSLLNMRCRVCRRKGGDEFMLLCDTCDNGYHMYCLRPPLKKVPSGNWFCNDCKPATPVKPRRSISRQVILEALSEESSSEESSESEEESSQESESESSETEEEEFVRRSTRLQKQHTPPSDVRTRRRGRSSKQPPPQSKQTKVNNKTKKDVPPATTNRKRRSSESDKAPQNKRTRSSQSAGDRLMKVTDELASQYFEEGSSAPSLRSKRKQAHFNLEQKMCRAILTELLNHPDSWPFLEPSQKLDLCFHEFDNTDLCSLEERMESHRYRLEDFVWDVRTIFLNSPQIHRRNSEASRAGTSLQKYFETRLMELGIRIDRDEQERKHRQFLYRMLTK